MIYYTYTRLMFYVQVTFHSTPSLSVSSSNLQIFEYHAVLPYFLTIYNACPYASFCHLTPSYYLCSLLLPFLTITCSFGFYVGLYF